MALPEAPMPLPRPASAMSDGAARPSPIALEEQAVPAATRPFPHVGQTLDGVVVADDGQEVRVALAGYRLTGVIPLRARVTQPYLRNSVLAVTVAAIRPVAVGLQRIELAHHPGGAAL